MRKRPSKSSVEARLRLGRWVAAREIVDLFGATGEISFGPDVRILAIEGRPDSDHIRLRFEPTPTQEQTK